MVAGNEERGAIGGTLLSITSCSSGMSSGLTNIDLTKETSDVESKREFQWAILANYENKAMHNMGKARYRMHLYQYAQKIWQCEIPLVHIGSI